MDLDGLALFTLLILMIIGLVASIGTYLLAISEGMNKTDEERRIEDKEQMEYLKNYKKGGKRNGRNNK